MSIEPGARGRSRAAQRARMLDALLASVAERGYAQTTIGDVCARAKVSRVTFYDAFEGLDACLLAVMDDAYRRVDALIAQGFAGAERWQDGIRTALALLLAFFDEQPLLARVCFVEVLAAGSWALEQRTRHVRALTAAIVARWPLPDGVEDNPLAAAGVMESLLGILHAHLLTRGEEPLVELLGPLVGLATAPYLDQDAVAAEIERGRRLAQSVLARRGRESLPGFDGAGAPSARAPSVEVPSLLRDARARRARDCLRHLAEHPGNSNRQIAAAVGIARDTQISTLLARLRGMGLIVKQAQRPGGPNAWSLSPHGCEVVEALQADREHSPPALDGLVAGSPRPVRA